MDIINKCDDEYGFEVRMIDGVIYIITKVYTNDIAIDEEAINRAINFSAEEEIPNTIIQSIKEFYMLYIVQEKLRRLHGIEEGSDYDEGLTIALQDFIKSYEYGNGKVRDTDFDRFLRRDTLHHMIVSRPFQPFWER